MSGIRIVREEEKLTYEGSGFKVFYRRLPAPIRSDIFRKCTPRRGGDPDFSRASIMMLEYSVLGWEGVFDIDPTTQTKSDVVFSSDKVKYLPDKIQADLLELLGENVETLEAERKN